MIPSESQIVKREISQLSDDEGLGGSSAVACPAATVATSNHDDGGRSTAPVLKLSDPAVLHTKIVQLRGRLCLCARRTGLTHSCFHQFSVTDLNQIVEMNVRFRKMTKEDMDQQAWLGLIQIRATLNAYVIVCKCSASS